MWPCLIWFHVHYRGKQEGTWEKWTADGKAEAESEKIGVLFFNEHSVQKAGTRASATDIIHLAGEDPVKGRGRQWRSVAKTTSLWSSCWFAPVLLLLYPPSFLLSRSPSLTHSVPPVAIQAWAVFAAHKALDLPASVLLCSAAHTRMGHTTTQISRKNTRR